jgi:hypothetical protein
MPTVFAGQQGGLTLRSVHLLSLHDGGWEMPLLLSAAFLCARHGIHTAGSAAVTHPGHVDTVEDSLAISIVDDRHVDARDSAVIGEFAPDPSSTNVAVAIVSEPIMHAAIEPNARPPVSGMPHV